MSHYKAYLIDLDGTMYRGAKPVEGASEFVKYLETKHLPFMFLTNNSSKTAVQVADKLNDLGIPAHYEQIMTSSMATAIYISQQQGPSKVYVIGEQGLRDAMFKEGHELVDDNPDFVVIGIDHNINYEKLTKACLHVRNGAALISTNADRAIPTERGMVPGNGALTSVISVSTGTEPLFIGKPESIIMDQALARLGYDRDRVLMIGDNYHTDISAGINAGMDTLMVETGVSSFQEVKSYEKQPTYKYKNLIDWMIEKKQKD
ncbi:MULTISPECIES: TIGR01457 family HAD-type hydrolase [Halobacillus]|uniref:Acid sugar phosphatase n=1 Tax=Halobacillus halophilus (strain ATCC 35676 / DSM 2266 / JCM 20832 / KCTC 3685 / LMG 17431 / NBRC 102448 / NCIMB 2269) TaxID=866895 RepID=I0JQ35_HALH3|nr:TIGR01457 family HAD-type hydrolase [Halobacillus halophilus]ASF40273.1 TIGR01457 family HAD-type hydrolase [Halobacillus halophilus]CCG46255.1 HAD superfamily hydrolase [Halobacillus halophilus DSM 2266]